MNRLIEEYQAAVARKHELSAAQLKEIGAEGFRKQWPVAQQ